MSTSIRLYLAGTLMSTVLTAQEIPVEKTQELSSEKHMIQNNPPKMKVEVWSDIMCPFCYIGKRHYEAAIQQFAHGADVEIEWKSFQLDPSIPRDEKIKKDVYQYLAERKGMSYDQSKKMHDNVVEMAKQAGLQYNYDHAVVANSFDAHRMIQLAKTKGLGDEAEELLFRSYFIEGKDFSDHATLISLGQSIGLDAQEISNAITSEAFAAKVENDIQEAQQLGIQGVPFFVFNRKYGVSGAQPTEAFLQTLEKSFNEFRKDNPVIQLEITDGPVCTPDGECK